MSGFSTPSDDFYSDPLKFMKNNIVIVQMTGKLETPLDRRRTRICLYKKNANVEGFRRDWRHEPMPVYFVGVPGQIYGSYTVVGGSFHVYFCPFRDNDTKGVYVGQNCKIFLTTAMDGCSLAIGSENRSGRLVAFHSNESRGMSTRAAMTSAQQNALQSTFAHFNATPTKFLEPDDYRSSKKGTDYSSTTFGVRNIWTGEWKFYAHRYSTDRIGSLFRYGWKEVKEF